MKIVVITGDCQGVESLRRCEVVESDDEAKKVIGDYFRESVVENDEEVEECKENENCYPENDEGVRCFMSWDNGDDGEFIDGYILNK